MEKALDRTLETTNAVFQIEIYEEKTTRTQTEPMSPQPTIIREERHVIFIDTATGHLDQFIS